MPEVHAKLSASGAKRWLNCPRSVALEALFPESTSPYAEEGTKAHAAAEKAIEATKKIEVKPVAKSSVTQTLEKEIKVNG